MNVFDLCSGVGGFSLGLEAAGMKTVAFCECEPYPRMVLEKRFPGVPIAGDIKNTRYESGVLYDGEKAIYRGAINVICGGFPCQPFSVAGKRLGTEDDRFIWPEMLRLVQEIRPDWVIVENVAGLINLGLDLVLSGLEGEDYTCQTFNIPACGIKAAHRRDRLWIVGNANFR